jgi:ABC-type bacteriocin/lantibiotic exporter with double-glycine peptidase domain
VTIVDRRLLVPEVVQTSAMDCGPAALACLLAGFGVPAGYARLRDACHTDVDGTSIDALHDAAILLGLDARQVMVPVEHLALAEAAVLPAVVVTHQPGGSTHFVVVWRRHGRLLQVMDPALGRRWVSVDRFLDEVYVHEFGVPAAAFEAWARSDALRLPLLRTLERLGAPATDLVASAERAPGWEALAALDAAARMTLAQPRGGRLWRRDAADRLIRLVGDPAAVESRHWFAWPTPDAPDVVTVRGAVLVHAPGRSHDVDAPLVHPDPPPGRFLRERLRSAGRWPLGVALGVAGVLAETGLLWALLTGGWSAGAVVALAALLLVLDGALAACVNGVGRRLEAGLRAELARRLPRLPDRYVRSRPLSDLVERAHRLHRLRELPAFAADAVRLGTHLALLPVLIGLTDPASAAPAALCAIVCAATGLLLVPAQAERDLRLRSHTGAIARFYLDALLGVASIRTLGAEPVVDREHTRSLGPWRAAVSSVHRAAVTAESLPAVLGLALVTWILATASDRVTDPAALVLLAWWSAGLPALAAQLAALTRRYPAYRSVGLRIVEPLATPVDLEPAPSPGPCQGVDVRFDDVTVLAGGRPVLTVDGLHIPAGAHVAVIGRSGSGKSTLVGLLLGWHTAARGRLVVDGQALDPVGLTRLRARTAWVDPTVTLWNRPVVDNLAYGNDGPVTAAVIEAAGLAPVIAAGAPVGLLSLGDAQRVRLGRALLRRDAALVVLDEPFRGLDRDERRILLGRARRWWPAATLLFVTHDLADTLAFDRVLVVDAGRVIRDGPPVAPR